MRLVGLLMALSFVAPPASAQALDASVGMPLLEQIAARGGDLKVGEWVTYSLQGGPGREAFWRVSVVGEDRDGEGRDARWVEIDIGTHPNMVSPVGQLRLLMSREAEKDSPWRARRMFMAHGPARPSEVDPAEVARFLDAPGGAPRRRAEPGTRAVRGTPQRIMTQSGSVMAEPVDLFYRGTRVRRIWMSPDIPVLGLAKLEIPGSGYVMEARDHGIGAKPMMVMPKPGTPTLSLESIGVKPPSSQKESKP